MCTVLSCRMGKALRLTCSRYGDAIIVSAYLMYLFDLSNLPISYIFRRPKTSHFTVLMCFKAGGSAFNCEKVKPTSILGQKLPGRWPPPMKLVLDWNGCDICNSLPGLHNHITWRLLWFWATSVPWYMGRVPDFLWVECQVNFVSYKRAALFLKGRCGELTNPPGFPPLKKVVFFHLKRTPW